MRCPSLLPCVRRLIAAIVPLAIAACGSPSSGADAGPGAADAAISGIDRRPFLAHVAADIIAPTYARFATVSDQLVTAVRGHCAALAAGGDGAATLTEAQGAWRRAIDVWERADVMMVGPGEMDHRALRDRVYAWPLAATCAVDRDVAAHWHNPAGYDVAARPNNARSLAAVEYLLFATTAAHTCFAEPVGWSQLGGDLAPARCALADALAGDVAAQAQVLDTAWRRDGGNYIDQLALAGAEGSSIPSPQEAVNRVSDSLFYVDRLVKDMKLAEAAGITDNACGTVEEPCDLEVEHRHADHASAAIVINLQALREVFTGTTETGDGPGFDDLLHGVGADDVATRMTAELDAALAAAAALPVSFRAALAARQPVLATHAAVKAFTDDLKSQFLTVLGLEIPDDVAGDND